MNIRVSLVVHNNMLMMGLKQLFKQEPDIELVNALSDSDLTCTSIIADDPDVIVLIINFLAGIDLAKEMTNHNCEAKIVMVSACNFNEYIQYAYKMGITTLIAKNQSIEHLLLAIRQARMGHRLFPPNDSLSGPALTEKELKVLKLVAEDRTNSDIGNKLYISKRTVEYHVSSIIEKLGAKSRVGAVVKGFENGLLQENYKI